MNKKNMQFLCSPLRGVMQLAEASRDNFSAEEWATMRRAMTSLADATRAFESLEPSPHGHGHGKVLDPILDFKED